MRLDGMDQLPVDNTYPENITGDAVTRMGMDIADRLAAQQPFPWPGDTAVKVAAEIRETVKTALPNKPDDVARALVATAFSGFLSRMVALSEASAGAGFH